MTSTDKENLLRQKEKQLVKNYLLVTIFVSFINLFCHLYSSYQAGLNASFWVSLVILLIFIFGYLGFRSIDFDFNFKNLMNFYLVSITVLVFIISIIFLPRQPTALIYLIPVPLGVYLVNNIQTAIKSTLLLILCFCSFFLIRNRQGEVPITDSVASAISIIFYILPMITATSTIMMLVYYMNEFLMIKHMPETDQAQSPKKRIETDTFIGKKVTSDKLDNLYIEILEYFDNKKPYKDPDFNIYELALALNTNRTYISNALNKKGNSNFQTFVNVYRIQQVKEDIDNGLYKDYTLNYLASKAGFKYQTTFNSVFKQIIGDAPSKYIELVEEQE